MLTPSNLAVGLLHQAGRSDIAAALRWMHRDPARPLAYGPPRTSPLIDSNVTKPQP